MNLTAFDLFSGGGGFRQGAEKAGIKIAAHCEIDKWAEKFYQNAFDTTEEKYFNDATKIDTGELPDFDLLLAGFPCQAFSIAGKRRGFDDSRGTMFFEVARILRDKRPRYFILENVKGLLNHDGGKTFQTILSILSDLGLYSVEWAVLNSKHFGVPQNRERVFIVGYPRRYGIGKVFPLGESNIICNKTGKIEEKIHAIAQTLKARDYRSWEGNYLLISSANSAGYEVAEDGDSINLTFTKSKTRRGRVGKGYAQTLQTSGNMAAYTKGAIRRLTPLECFRLQGFSDEVFYKGSQGISDAQLYKIAGNSVTVNVVYEIAKRIVELERSEHDERTK